MKRFICLILIILLVSQLTTVSFASSDVNSGPITSITIPISTNLGDIQTMNDNWSDVIAKEFSLKNDMLQRGGTEGKLTLNFNDLSFNKNNIVTSGDIIINIGDTVKKAKFVDSSIELITITSFDKIYVGVLESTIMINGKETPLLIDLASDLSFKKNVASISIGILEENPMLLFFGDVFPEYTKYVEKIFENNGNIDSTQNDYTHVQEGNTERSSDNDYVHCGIATNSKIGSNTASGETVILTAAKRDFRDRNADIGFELIRVFSRSNKARAAVSGATRAVPYKAIMEFECTTKDFLEVTNTYPSPSSISLPQFVGIFSSLNGGVAFAEIVTNTILNMISSVSRTIDSTNSTSENNYVKITTNIDSSNAYDADLPSSQASSEAKTNEENGLMCKIKYESVGNDGLYNGLYNGYASIYGSIQYRVYTGTNHKISTLTTGKATITHSIFNR